MSNYKLKAYESSLCDVLKGIPNLKERIDFYVNEYKPVSPHGNVIACGWWFCFNTIEGLNWFNANLRDERPTGEVLTSLLVNVMYKLGFPKNENLVKHPESNIAV